MMIYTVHISNSKDGASNVEHFEMSNNYGYDEGMCAQTKPLPPVPSPKKAR